VAYRRTAQIQARLDEQRASSLAAAIGLLAESGYRSCSVAAVAARADVAAGTVYRHFDNKAALVAEVFRTVVGREVQAVGDSIAFPGSATERLVAVIETFAGRALKAPRLAYALLAEPVDPVVDALRLQFRIAFRDLVAGLVGGGVAAGELAPQQPQVVAAAVVGAIGEALVGPLASGAAEADTVPTLISFAVRGIGATDEQHA
jgi:AcrR family transcriptional regulator